MIYCRYVWEHLDIGYVQGMCDLAAPLLVIFDDGKSIIFYRLSLIFFMKSIISVEMFERYSNNDQQQSVDRCQ